MRLGAIFLLFITKFKREFGDTTASVPPGIATGPNFDYDGKVLPGISVRMCQNLPNCWKTLKAS